MRIVTFEEFLKLPPNTFYMEYEPCAFGELKIKSETLNAFDFYVTDLHEFDYYDTGEMIDTLDDMLENGTSVNLDLNVECRDGSFDITQLYLIYEKADVLELQRVTKLALENFKEE